jgi:hypothetical protein
MTRKPPPKPDKSKPAAAPRAVVKPHNNPLQQAMRDLLVKRLQSGEGEAELERLTANLVFKSLEAVWDILEVAAERAREDGGESLRAFLKAAKGTRQ